MSYKILFCFIILMASCTPFTEKERIMVIATHEDDESIGAGGIISRAVDEN